MQLFISVKNRQILKRILLLLKPYTKKIIVVMACTLLVSLIRVIYPQVSQHLIDDGLIKMNLGIIVKFSLAILLLVIIEQCFNAIETKYRIYINSMLTFTLAKTVLKKIFRLKINFFYNTKIGEIINNMNNDVQNTSAISNEQVFVSIISVFSIAGGLAGLAIINWKMTILAILLIPTQLVLVKYISKKKRGLFELNMGKYQSFWGWYSDIIDGVKEIKLWTVKTMMMGTFVKKQRELIKSNVKIAILDTLNQISASVVSNMIVTVIYLVGAVMIINHSLTVGGLFAFIAYINFITNPFFYLMEIGGYIFSIIIPSAERLFNFLDMECENNVKGQRYIRLEIGNVNGNIRFENVSFSYENEKILENVSFEINKGEKVALTGANGSGKTTIVNLLLRFYKPDSGRILLDGIDINSISLKDYRECISVICQDIHLFDASIKENITLFRKIEDSTVYNAARQSGADEFINKMPLKYEAMIGRNGSQISGGERQKIAVARAFAKKAPILIMDEATSNFDAESDILVNRILENELNDMTAVIITHKPDILKKVDKVLVLHNGEVSVNAVKAEFSHLLKLSIE